MALILGHVVVTATNAREPVIERAWPAEGAHVNAVGAGAPTSRELATLGEVAAGLRPGRTSRQEITLFRSLGLGIEDLAAAERAVDNARRLGLGTEVEL